jgi:DNA-binding XRE family transcriptional regulator
MLNEPFKKKINQLAKRASHPKTLLAMLKDNEKILTEIAALRSITDILQADEAISEFDKKNYLAEIRKELTIPKELIEGNQEALNKHILDRIEELRKAYIKNHTFALPSGSIMFTLLSLFSGKPIKTPGALQKANRTDQEQVNVEKYVQSVITHEVTGQSYDASTNLIQNVSKIGLLKDGVRIKATANLDNVTLFNDESLAVYIKKTFGAEGLRHFLALIIGIEENGRTGIIEWNVQEHLGRLGYKKKQGGGFKHEQKQAAIAIVKLLSELVIIAYRKDKQKEYISFKQLFSVIEMKAEKSIKTGYIKETFVIRAEDYWYSLTGTEKQAPYTKLLKDIIKESHRDHYLTLLLAPLLAVFWRMESERVISVENLMNWCSLDTTSSLWKRELRTLEKELNYMQERRYLGNWSHNGQNLLPSDCVKPLKCMLTLEPPNWLRKEIAPILDKAKSFKKEPDRLSKESFKSLYQQSGLSAVEFGNLLGVSKQTIHKILREDQPVSPKLSKTIQSKFDLPKKLVPSNNQTGPN